MDSVTLLASLVVAATAPCQGDPTDIRVIKQIERPNFDFSKSGTELTRLRYENPTTADYRLHKVVGLTDAAVTVTTRVRITSAPAGLGQICAWPSFVEVTVSTEPVVFISAGQGKCERDATLAHEMQHVATDRAIIERYLPIFRNEVESAVATIGAVGPSPRYELSGIQQEIHDRIHAAASRTLKALNVERSVEQKKLDSTAEYARLSSACSTRPRRKNS